MAKEKKGKIITITSMKGGVGKSTVALLLTSVYKKLNKKVVILDLDLYSGDIAFLFNCEVKNTIYNISDDINNNRYKGLVGTDYICKYDDNIDIVAAPKDPRYASKIDRRDLEILIQSLKNTYDVILIDTNHTLDMYSMIAFDASDKILNLFTNDAMDLKGTKTFVSICDNVGFNNLVIVLNQSNCLKKNYFSNYDIKNLIGHNIDYTIPEALYVSDYDMHVADGNIFQLFSEEITKKVYSKLEKLALDLLEEQKGFDSDEKK